MGDRDDVDRVRDALNSIGAVTLCSRLSLDRGATEKRRDSIKVCCPWRAERTPSCHVQDRNGMILAFCHGCGAKGDALDLVGAVHGLDPKGRGGGGFREVLERAASLVGIYLDTDRKREPSSFAASAPRAPLPVAAPSYPDQADVAALWDACKPVSADPEVAAWLRSRALDPEAVDRWRLARALPPSFRMTWARYKGPAEQARPWGELGYRCILPLYDEAGDLRSVRARSIIADAKPKALPPSGGAVSYSTKGLLLACPAAKMMLAIGVHPWWQEAVVCVAEGEPDYLTWATKRSHAGAFAVLGIPGSGALTQGLIDRIPDASTVVLRTDLDDTGNEYAATITTMLRARCDVFEESAEERQTRRAAKEAAKKTAENARKRG